MCDGQKLLLIVVVLTNRKIHLTLFSTDIKILQTSFDILTSRLTPSATDRQLIIYCILLRHLFLCCRSCVQWVMRFFDTADVSALLLENNILLISSDRYFETVFWVAKSYTPFLCTYSLSAWWFSNTDISQGSVTTRLRRGKIFKYYFSPNLPLSPTMKEFWKSVNMWQKLRTRLWCLAFLLIVYIMSAEISSSTLSVLKTGPTQLTRTDSALLSPTAEFHSAACSCTFGN